MFFNAWSLKSDILKNWDLYNFMIIDNLLKVMFNFNIF